MPSIRIKNNGPVLLLHTIFIRHRDCFLLFVATDGKDGYGLEFEKVGPTFFKFQTYAHKKSSKNNFALYSPMNLFFVDTVFILYRRIFRGTVKPK